MSSSMERIDSDRAQELLKGIPPGPWGWSIHKGQHRARLVTIPYETPIVELNNDTVNGRVADIISAAPELAFTVIRLSAEIEELKQQALQTERAAIVAWLRREWWVTCADSIERGEHEIKP